MARDRNNLQVEAARTRAASLNAEDLRSRAARAMVANDPQLARELLEAARRQENIARRLRKRMRNRRRLSEAKRSPFTKVLSDRERRLSGRAERLRRLREAKAEIVKHRVDTSQEKAAPPPQPSENRPSDRKESQYGRVARHAAVAEPRAKRQAAVEEPAGESAEELAKAKAKRRRTKSLRAQIRELMRQERRKSYGLGHDYAKGRTAEIAAARRARTFIAKLEERAEKDHTAKKAAKKAAKWAARAAPFKKAAKWAYKATTGKDYRRKLSDKEQLAHAHAIEKELAKKSKEINKDLRDVRAARREAVAQLKRAAAAREIPKMRVPGSDSERAWAEAAHAAAQARARVAAAKQALDDHRLRRRAAANVRSALQDKIEKSLGGRIGRAVGKVKHVLGAPKRKVAAIRSAIATKFLEFKKKHGIDKPLKPDQRRTLMQKLFGSDKGYRGEAYVAGGMGGIGMMLLTGRAGFQHPDHRAKMRELAEEMRHAHDEVPHVLHKGAKGGVFYYSPEGKKVYVARGGIGGVLSMFKAGLSGARLYR